MKIDFNTLDEQVIPGFKGGDKEIGMCSFSDGHNKIARMRMIPGSSVGEHTHQTNSEIIFIEKGSCHVIYDGQKIPLVAGDVHYCPKGHTHCIVNDSGSETVFRAVIPEQ